MLSFFYVYPDKILRKVLVNSVGVGVEFKSAGKD